MGATMDVAMDITSALFEIKQKVPDISFWHLVQSGFTIGRDIMGTMANTLILAYIGQLADHRPALCLLPGVADPDAQPRADYRRAAPVALRQHRHPVYHPHHRLHRRRAVLRAPRKIRYNKFRKMKSR